jgi:hypothetical protein
MRETDQFGNLKLCVFEGMRKIGKKDFEEMCDFNENKIKLSLFSHRV